MWKFLPLLSLVACQGDDGLVVFDSKAPTAEIISPLGGAFDEDAPITFMGEVDDGDTPLAELEVEWISSSDLDQGEESLGFGTPDADGIVVLSTYLAAGNHTITLRVHDPEDHFGRDSVTIEVVDVPDMPTITIEHPDGIEMALENELFRFVAQVSDRQDAADALTGMVSTSPGGPLCDLEINDQGRAACSGALASWSHPYTITFEVTDTDGNTASEEGSLEVVSRDNYDADGDGFTPNENDCDDDNANTYPGAPEICDGLDNDCLPETGVDVGSECWDDDGDNYCESPPCVNASGSVPDCDDTNANISPSAPEVLNGIDDDCDGFVDEGTAAYDDDGDGYCESPPCVNATSSLSDCDDDDYSVYPGATEVCGDDLDNNCNGLLNEEDAIGCLDFYYDGDGDTYGVRGGQECWCEDGRAPYTGVTADDCYDSNPDAHPDQTAYFTNDRGDGSYDYNCSGSNERQWTDLSPGCSWDLVYISCECDGAGWERTAPTCGNSANWIEDCSATYDPICYGLCMLSANPVACLLSSCGATCDPEYDSRTQACR
ncbi:MAG: putative metal-binding motif-containing protein [Pseudomonadota bacterium]